MSNNNTSFSMFQKQEIKSLQQLNVSALPCSPFSSTIYNVIPLVSTMTNSHTPEVGTTEAETDLSRKTMTKIEMK